MTVADIDIAEGMQSLQFPLPERSVTADGLLRLQFDVTPERSPQALGLNVDGRRLGIGLEELTVSPIAQD
jgi:hypothetical protein